MQSSTSGPSNTVEPSNGTPIPLGTQWNDCKGMDTIFTWPGDMGPSKPPGNWSNGKGEGTSVGLVLYQCKRFSWGPFERPVAFVAEVHNNMDPPPDCRLGTWGTFRALNAFYVNDSAVAKFLRETYGFPAVHANITVADSNSNGIRSTTWQWTPDGGKMSQVSSSEVDAYGQDVTDIERWVWIPDGRVHFLDWEYTETLNEGDLTATPGHMNPPMLYAKSGPDPYVGRGDFLAKINVSAQIQIFGDEECKQPLES
jgi:hypothetical protein